MPLVFGNVALICWPFFPRASALALAGAGRFWGREGLVALVGVALVVRLRRSEF